MSFKFLYEEEQPKMDVSFLEEYSERLDSLENTHALVTSGLEANIELLSHIENESFYMLNMLDMGIEDNEKKKKELSFFSAMSLVIKIIIRLLKLAFKIIGIAGVNILGLMRMKINSYADVAEKVLNNARSYMKEHNIKEDDACKPDFKENVSAFLGINDITDFMMEVTGDYRKGLELGLEEYENITSNMQIIYTLQNVFNNINIVKDFKTLENLTADNIISDELYAIIKKYSIDIYKPLEDLNLKSNMQDYILNNATSFKIGGRFETSNTSIDPSSISLVLPSRVYHVLVNRKEVRDLSLEATFVLKNEDNYNNIINSKGKSISDIKNNLSVYKLVKGRQSIPRRRVEVEVLKLDEIEDIIKRIRKNADRTDKYNSEFKKLSKKLRSIRSDVEHIKKDVDDTTRFNVDATSLFLKSISNVMRDYVNISTYIVRHLGEDIGIGIPVTTLVITSFLKAICVGELDYGALREALRKEADTIREEYKDKI